MAQYIWWMEIIKWNETIVKCNLKCLFYIKVYIKKQSIFIIIICNITYLFFIYNNPHNIYTRSLHLNLYLTCSSAQQSVGFWHNFLSVCSFIIFALCSLKALFFNIFTFCSLKAFFLNIFAFCSHNFLMLASQSNWIFSFSAIYSFLVLLSFYSFISLLYLK